MKPAASNLHAVSLFLFKRHVHSSLGVLAIFVIGLLSAGCGDKTVREQERKLLTSELGGYDQRVMRIQLLLIDLGHDIGGGADGIIGPDTRQGIKRFQRSNHLSPSGFIGGATWREMASLLKEKPRFQFEKLQLALQRAGFYSGPIDGIWGWRTEQAVASFQKANDIEPTATITVETWGKLSRFIEAVEQQPDTPLEGFAKPSEP